MKALSILIAEDEPMVRMDLKEMLEGAGYIVCGEACNGVKAVEMAKQRRPDLVILDVKMPGLDGFEAAKVLQAENIPVLFLTAYNQVGFVKRAEKVGVYGYLVKPISESDLQPAVQVAYARWKEMQSIQIELEKARKQLEMQKVIAHAKAILAFQKGITEYEAHRLMQQRAMNARLSVAEVASGIVADAKKRKINQQEI
jgi:AmiR/NasT family two-component response regulator